MSKVSKMKRLWADPVWRARQRKRISVATRLAMKRPDVRVKLGTGARGKPSWNRGLTKETSASVAKNAERMSATKRKQHRPAWNRGRKCPLAPEVALARTLPEYRKKQSDARKQLWKNPDYARKVMAGLKADPNPAERKLARILAKNFPKEFKLNVLGGVVIDGKIPDFVNVNGKKVVVELFGRYWHKPGTERSRARIFSRYGFKTVVVWDNELQNESLVVRRIGKVLQGRC